MGLGVRSKRSGNTSKIPPIMSVAGYIQLSLEPFIRRYNKNKNPDINKTSKKRSLNNRFTAPYNKTYNKSPKNVATLENTMTENAILKDL